MKKIYMMALVAILFVSNVLADNNNEFKLFTNLNSEKTINGLSKYLNADSEQKEQLEYLFSLTEKKMKWALSKNNDVAAENAKWFNLGNAKLILTDEQYRKYLRLLNLTLNSMTNSSDEIIAEN